MAIPSPLRSSVAELPPSDPDQLSRCIAYVRETPLPILSTTVRSLVASTSRGNDTWRQGALLELSRHVQNDAFLALRLARDAARASLEIHCDVPGSFAEMIALFGIGGLVRDYIGCPTLENDWPPTGGLAAEVVNRIRIRMSTFGRFAIKSARVFANSLDDQAAEVRERALVVTTLYATTDLALALAAPLKLDRHLSAHPGAEFTDAVYAQLSVHPDAFRAELVASLGWPRLSEAEDASLLARCEAAANAWRSLFPVANPASEQPSNVIAIR